MKKRFALGILAIGFFSVSALAACGKNSQETYTEFSFSISLADGAKVMRINKTAKLVIDEIGGKPGTERSYTFASSNPNVATVVADGDGAKVTAVAVGSVRIAVKETTSNLSRILTLTVTDAEPASGGFNYASLSGTDAVAKRTEILGQLEKYAMDNHLTGLTLFENGGYVKYSERVTLPTTNYVTGYGFGLLSEGSVDSDMAKEENPDYKRYLHSAMSSDPKMINARNDTGSQVSDLEGYITSSFWGTKLNAAHDQYEWYPVLAKDTVSFNGQSKKFDRPIPVVLERNDDGTIKTETEVKPGEEPNPLGLYSTWRIYVKTGADGGIKYRYNGTSWGKDFDGRNVTIDDYEFAYRLLLTGSHNLKRGPEMAGDQTYGIVGAQRYNTNTKNATDEQAVELWNNMKASGQLGISTGHDATNGDYIQLTILNPIDRFTAMYTFSSNLLSPLPEEFISTIGGGSVKEGATRYGSFNNDVKKSVEGHTDKILDHVLSVGPYMLEKWDKNQTIVFKKNNQWNEPGRYNIAGIKLIYIDTTSSTTAVYDRFTNVGDLDSCGIPTKYIKAEVGKPRVYETKGDATFKLNVNSCTQDTWNDLFGAQGKINKNSKWKVKPWMSNDNFLNGLFYSINRKEFADKRGVKPSINYFSDAYLNDPENGLSYNDSEAHKKAVEDYQTYDSSGNSTFGYSKDRAILSFRAAVRELVNDKNSGVKYGTKKEPTKLDIEIWWMYQTDEKEYGEDIAKYFTAAFNDPQVCEGKIVLNVIHKAVTNWQDVYNEHLMKGQFDLGFGAISGNTYNPLNFMEVLKSDNSSGFTLNWGTDTSIVTPNKPLIYENKMWSFDALWAVAGHGGVVNEGEIAKTVETCFMIPGMNNNFYNGANFQVATKFIDVPSAKLDITRVQIYVAGFGGVDVKYTTSVVDGMIVASINLSAEDAAQINSDMRHALKMDDPNKPNQYNETPFTLENYNKYWAVEVSYSLAIKPEGSTEFGTPTESYVTAAANEDAWED